MIEALRLVASLLFPLGVVLAALRDLTSYTIPNRISVFLLVAFLPAALIDGLGPRTLALSLATAIVVLAASLVLFARRWIGGGDAKLFAMSALWLGFPAVLDFAMWTALAGGGLAVLLMAGRRIGAPAIARGPAWVGRLLTPGGAVPYGLAICFGALMAYPMSPIAHATFAAR